MYGKNAAIADRIADEFMNKVYIWVQDAPYIQFDREDPKPPRQHVFHVEYPHEWKRHNLVRLFKDAGPVNISFLSDTSAYVALINKQNASRVKGIKGVVITSYDKYHLAKRNAEYGGGSTSKIEQGKKTVSNEKQPTMKAETTSENKSQSKKRGGKNRNKNNDLHTFAESGTKRKKSSEEMLFKDQSNEDSPDADDISSINPPPSKCQKQFETNDNWN